MKNSCRGFFSGTAILILLLISWAAPAFSQYSMSTPVAFEVPGMSKVKTRTDITYKEVDGYPLKMDVYMPPKVKKGTRAPTVFLIHGGYLHPDTSPMPKDWASFKSWGRILAASGFVAVTFNHRYYSWDDGNMSRSFEDVADAVRYVRSNAFMFDADHHNISLWAFSGGGLHLSLAMDKQMPYVRSLVGFYPMLDLVPALSQVNLGVTREQARKYSPVHFLKPENFDIPPVFIARAGLDSKQLNRSIDLFVVKALSLNEQIEIVNHANGRHGFDTRDNDVRTADIIRRAIRFTWEQASAKTNPKLAGAPMPGKIHTFLLNGEIEKARKLINRYDQLDPELYARLTSEQRLNVLGYEHLHAGKVNVAVRFFQWIVELYPGSANAYDSLSDGLVEAGRNAEALENAKKALELLKDLGKAGGLRIELVRESAERKIEKLQE